MKLVGEYQFDGPREDVWDLVRDPEVLATALPGGKRLEKVAENKYEGEMNVRIGPVAGDFAGRLIVSDEEPPQNCTLTVEGRGKPGFVKGSGRVSLFDQGDGTTLMKYEGDVQIGGRLASVGQRMLDTASKSMIRQGLEAMNAALQARVAAEKTGEQIAFEAPSEGAFMAAVARDMAGEFFTPSRIAWIFFAVLVILAIVTLIFTGSGGG